MPEQHETFEQIRTGSPIRLRACALRSGRRNQFMLTANASNARVASDVSTTNTTHPHHAAVRQ
jgi:hypothetical protein